MYSTDLEKISLEEFQEILSTIELLPGRKILLSGHSSLVESLKRKGIYHLGALQNLLKNKKRYPELSEEFSVSQDYLTVLNREINSYVAKPLHHVFLRDNRFTQMHGAKCRRYPDPPPKRADAAHELEKGGYDFLFYHLRLDDVELADQFPGRRCHPGAF